MISDISARIDDAKMIMPTEIYSRVVGYFRPVSQWNVGKKSEWADRKTCGCNPADYQ